MIYLPKISAKDLAKNEKIALKFADSKKSITFAPAKQNTLASAAIAQSVEHFIRNEKVAGSSPARGS